MSGAYNCKVCEEIIEGEEYLVHQQESEYDVYHVGCWERR